MMCGAAFSTANGYEATCSQPCEEIREQQERETLEAIIHSAVPDALAELGLDSIDEYPAWKHDQSRGAIYFIQAGSGPIKIGFSKDVSSRLMDLQVASPANLSLLATIEGYPEDETAVHCQFDGYRIRGEWFQPGPELLNFIASL